MRDPLAAIHNILVYRVVWKRPVTDNTKRPPLPLPVLPTAIVNSNQRDGGISHSAPHPLYASHLQIDIFFAASFGYTYFTHLTGIAPFPTNKTAHTKYQEDS